MTSTGKTKLKFSGFLGLNQPRRVLALEISDDWLKLVGAKVQKKKKSVQCAAFESVKGLSETEISFKIEEFLKKNKFKPHYVILNHPTHNLTTRFLAIPSTDPAEIKDILELQAVKQTPYAREEISPGFRILNLDETGYSRILLAISHRDVISKYYRIPEMAKVPPQQISLAFEGIHNWYQHLCQQSEDLQTKTTLFLDVDSSTTDLLILMGGKIVFGRSIGVGSKHIQEQGLMVENKFLREVQLSVESGQAELQQGKIEHVVLTGVEGPLKNLVALLSRELSLPCEVVPMFREFRTIVPETIRQNLEKAEGSFVSVLGLAIEPQTCEVNLILPEIEIRKNLEERAKDLAFLGTMMLSLVTLVSAIAFHKYFLKITYLDALKAEYEAIEPEANDLERLVAKMKLAQEQAGGGQNFLEVLYDVRGVLPDSIYLTGLNFDDQEKSITIRGISEEMSSVFQLLSTLEAAPHLEFVKTRNVTKRKVDDQDVAEFEIVANVVPGGSNNA
ncbi:MAG: pilus assembly protein PilM [Candidatus Omnitrophica bacterium]|nr:pilus assembly protein PilM [Candidatus Omnitrophota bacterium]